MAEEQKKTRKAARPRLDAIVRHVVAGSYDEDLDKLQSAIDRRNQKLQHDLMERVNKVFGKHARVVVDEQSVPEPPQGRVNPFLKGKTQDPELAAAEQAALDRERELAAEAGDVLPDDGEDSPDIESRSPVIGSVE